MSKSLLLFAQPGIIYKNNLSIIMYLKAYGANCFGGIIAKSSLKGKSTWVDKNSSDIVNYENGILLNKANNKVLFLSFCMEYKNFHHQYSFYTYLPIQLDATCNGFQHLALLSNETI